jgi:hypothetical protein
MLGFYRLRLGFYRLRLGWGLGTVPKLSVLLRLSDECLEDFLLFFFGEVIGNFV